MTVKHTFLLFLSALAVTVFAQEPCAVLPSAPEVTGAEICYGAVNIPLTATSSSTDGLIYWYDSELGTTPLNNFASAQYMPIVSAAGVYTYYASQIVDGCESPKASVTYEIKPHPVAPIITPQPDVCENEDNPILTVTGNAGASYNWYYGTSRQNLYNNTANYTHQITEPGRIRYYVTQTVRGCEGAEAGIDFYIDEMPDLPNTTDAVMCSVDDIPVLRTDDPNNYWYYTSDDYAAPFITGGGYTYRPNGADTANAINGVLTFYLRRLSTNRACRTEAVPVTLTIVKNPSFYIRVSDVQCIGSGVGAIMSIRNVSPPYNPDNGSSIEWKLYGDPIVNIAPEGNNVEAYDTLFTRPGEYLYVASYSITENGFECFRENLGTYRVKAPPALPSINTDPIDLEDYVSFEDTLIRELYGLEDYSDGEFEIRWQTNPPIYDGSFVYSRDITITGDELQQVAGDGISVNVEIQDLDPELASSCKTTADFYIDFHNVGIPDQTKVNFNILTSPNPSHDQLTIEISSANYSETTIEIIDILGKTMLSTQAPTNQAKEINVSELSTGIYTLRVNVGNEISTQQLIIE